MTRSFPSLIPVILLLTGFVFSPSPITEAQESDASPPVRVGTVVVRAAAAGKTFIGTIEPARRSVVGAEVAGKVDVVHVETGDLVDPVDADSGAVKGELVHLRDTAAKLLLSVAEAQLQIARQELAELQAGERPEEIKRLESTVTGAEAVFTYASKRFDQMKTLRDRNAMDQGNVDQALSARHAAEQVLLGARAELEMAVNGARPEALARAQALLVVAQEELSRLADNYANHIVRAPFRGYVARKYVEKGAWVAIGDPVAEIIELDEVEIRVAVPEEDVSRVRPGMTVRVDVAAIESVLSRSDVLTGTVYRVVPDGDVRSRTFPVRIRMQNRSNSGLPLLKPGMLARVVLLVGEERDAIFVPKDALVLNRSEASVFVLDDSRNKATVREIPVKLGGADDLFIQVTPEDPDALANGMRVVTEGNERLTNGQSVEVYE